MSLIDIQCIKVQTSIGVLIVSIHRHFLKNKSKLNQEVQTQLNLIHDYNGWFKILGY